MINNRLVILKEHFCILKLSDNKADISWVYDSPWYSITKTDDEISIICPEKSVPNGINAEAENGWRCIQIEGILEFSLTGVLVGILKVLADAEISILAVSTYNTDYVFIKEKSFKYATEALQKANYKFKD